MTTPPDHQSWYHTEAGLASALQDIATIAVDQCAAVRPGEQVLVLTDTAGDPRLAELVADRARWAGADVVLASFPWVPTIHDIPPRIVDLIDASEVVIPLCKSRILYSGPIKRVPEHGRLLYMADVPTEQFLRPIVRETDYEQLARYAEAFAQIFDQDGELRVTTPAGTDARMTMVASRGMSISSCRARDRGDRDYLPGGAWFGCPIEESVNGVFVIDSSMEPGVIGGVVHQPIALHVTNGTVVKIEGGDQVAELEAWLAGCDDQIRGIAHNGGGFNARARTTGNLMEDERILGSFNIAGGNNQSGWPGSNSSSFHWDAMMLRASYSLGGVPICEDGQLTHPLLVQAAGATG